MGGVGASQRHQLLQWDGRVDESDESDGRELLLVGFSGQGRYRTRHEKKVPKRSGYRVPYAHPRHLTEIRYYCSGIYASGDGERELSYVCLSKLKLPSSEQTSHHTVLDLTIPLCPSRRGSGCCTAHSTAPHTNPRPRLKFTDLQRILGVFSRLSSPCLAGAAANHSLLQQFNQ